MALRRQLFRETVPLTNCSSLRNIFASVSIRHQIWVSYYNNDELWSWSCVRRYITHNQLLIYKLSDSVIICLGFCPFLFHEFKKKTIEGQNWVGCMCPSGSMTCWQENWILDRGRISSHTDINLFPNEPPFICHIFKLKINIKRNLLNFKSIQWNHLQAFPIWWDYPFKILFSRFLLLSPLPFIRISPTSPSSPPLSVIWYLLIPRYIIITQGPGGAYRQSALNY
jgi:hypothetical protein